MILNNVTPTRIANFLAGLAHKASSIPGCKVKQSHLLEAYSDMEGKENWNALEAEINKNSLTHNFLCKEVELVWIENEMVVTNVDVEINVHGYRGKNIRIYAHSDTMNGFWIRECVPSFESYQLDGTTTAAQAMDNFKVALTEATEICNWLNNERCFRVHDFNKGWTIKAATTEEFTNLALSQLSKHGLVQPANSSAAYSPVLKRHIKQQGAAKVVIKSILKADHSKTIVEKELEYKDSFSINKQVNYLKEKNPEKHFWFEKA